MEYASYILLTMRQLWYESDELSNMILEMLHDVTKCGWHRLHKHQCTLYLHHSMHIMVNIYRGPTAGFVHEECG